MTLPETYEFVIEQGKTFKWWFAVEYPDGEIADLVADGYPNARFVVAPEAGAVPVIDINQSDYIVLERVFDALEGEADRMQWSGYIEIPASVTALLEPWGRGPMEFVIDNGAGDVISVLIGTAILETGVIP